MMTVRKLSILLLLAGAAVWSFADDEDAWRQGRLNIIERCQAIQERAVAYGILKQVKSYPELVRDFHRENARRREMKANGQVFYGPVQFRQEVWFEVWFDQLERELLRRGAAAQAAAGVSNR